MSREDPEEMICTWPNGETREVMAMSRFRGRRRIIWNERVDTGCAAVTGMEETVPIPWLSAKAKKGSG